MFQIRTPCNDAPRAISRVIAPGLSLLLSIGGIAPVSWSATRSTAVPAGIAIHGTVFSVDDQAPIEGARVHLGDSRSGEIVSSTPTADDGAFRLDRLRPGTWEVAVESGEGLFVVAAPLVLVENDGGPLTLHVMVRRSDDPQGAASKLRLSDGRASVWNNPITAALIVVGAAIVAGVLIDAATDDEDTASN